ncbi:hypothetical protein [Klebsiella pasteurii]|uniref:hypothetical protein n=1 Tax=Klebsiella pasteurii TaxID=2587529 RepID=UPI0032DA0B4A
MKAKPSKNMLFVQRLSFLRPFSFVNICFYFLTFLLAVLTVTFLLLAISGNVDGNRTTYIAILASLIAITTLSYNIRRHVSEDYSKDAKEYLKRAYEMLAPKNPSDLPPNDRMSWLTAARFLKIADRLGQKIIMSSHKKIFIEEKQYWRWKLGEIIKNFPNEYYAQSPEKFIMYSQVDKEPLSEHSLYVIHKFIEWDDTYEDPLKTERFSEDDKKILLRRGFTNLYHLLKDVDGIRRQR